MVGVWSSLLTDALASASAVGWSALLLTVLLTPAMAVVLVTLTHRKRVAEVITAASVLLVAFQALGSSRG